MYWVGYWIEMQHRKNSAHIRKCFFWSLIMEQKAGGAFGYTGIEKLGDWLLQFMGVKRKIYPKKDYRKKFICIKCCILGFFFFPASSRVYYSWVLWVIWFIFLFFFYFYAALYWDKIWGWTKKTPFYLKDLGLFFCPIIFWTFKDQQIE